MNNGRKAIIRERGNGLADVGDYVSVYDGELYRVVSRGRTETGRSPGAGDWCLATVELADWDDVDDESAPVCTCELED